MRAFTKVASLAVASTMAAMVIGAAPVGAASTPNGVGGTTTKTSVLSLQLGQNGSLLNLSLLSDVGGANIDAKGGTPQAGASLVPITLSSPLLHLNLSTPPISTLAPGGSTSAESQPLTLTSLGIPALLATATLKPADLHSQFASTAAHSQMSAAEIDNLGLVGGALASVDLLSSTLGADAVTSQSDGARAVNIGTLKLLDLGALLKGIGADLTSLPLGSLSSLLSTLNLPVSGLAAGASLSDTVQSLSDALTNLRTTLVGAVTTITAPIDQATQSLLGTLNLPIPTVGSLVTTVNNLITTVQTTLVNLLKSALSALDSFPLVQLSGLVVGITTKATDSLKTSSAQVGMSPLSLTVAGVKLPLLDPTAIVSTVNGVLAQANSLLNGLLGTLGLPTNLLSLNLLDKATNVSQKNGYVTSAAGLNVLDLKVANLDPSVILNDLAKLTGPLASSLLGGSSALSGLLGSSDSMGALGTLLNQAAPLLNGAQLQIASLAGASTYAAAEAPAAVTPTPAPPTSLPLTGGDPELAILGVLFIVATLGALRWRRVVRAATIPVD